MKSKEDILKYETSNLGVWLTSKENVRDCGG